jgi:hypothetical protein
MKIKSFLCFLGILILMNISTSAFAQTITVSSPRDGERWNKGSQQAITWQAPGISGNVMLFALAVGTNAQYKIAEGIPAGQGTYPWIAGTIADGSLQPNRQYRIRISKDAQHFGESPGAITLLPPASNQVSVTQPGGGQIQPNQQPKGSITKPTQPNFDIARAPKLEIVEFKYNYREKRLEALVKNTGNAPFAGRFYWEWNTDCGGRSGTKDVPPNQSEWLVSPGLFFDIPCNPRLLDCTIRAAFTIEPVSQNGTRYARSQVQKDFYRYENSQFLLSDQRLFLHFLHGSHWVNNSQEYIITGNDAYDYDSATKIATFFVGFPIKNCGSRPGRVDNNHDDQLYYTVMHSPSNQFAIRWTPVADLGGSYSAGSLVPGQGILKERAVSLKVQSGIYMLRVYAGYTLEDPILCTISIRFADDLIH